MKRREFLAIGAAVALPLAAQAQQASMPVIGFLGMTTPLADVDYLRAFHRALKETGFIEGENVVIVHRYADSQPDRLPALAAELVGRKPAVIVSVHGPVVALAAKAATAT